MSLTVKELAELAGLDQETRDGMIAETLARDNRRRETLEGLPETAKDMFKKVEAKIARMLSLPECLGLMKLRPWCGPIQVCPEDFSKVTELRSLSHNPGPDQPLITLQVPYRSASTCDEALDKKLKNVEEIVSGYESKLRQFYLCVSCKVFQQCSILSGMYLSEQQ